MRFQYPLLFLFLVTTLATVAQPVPSPNATDARGRKQGAWSKSWSNGRVRYEGQFKDDIPVGEFGHYDEEGRLVTLQRHAGDGHVSRAQHFYPDRSIMAVGKYVDQVKDSTWNYYAPDGGLRRVERYRQGVLHGEQVSYYPDGQVAEKEMRENGVLHGESRSWFNNGTLKSEATYVQGEIEGRMLFQFPNGKKEIEGNMVDGLREGTWYYFNSDGSLQLQVLYRKGEVVREKKENGTFKEYYDDDQLMSEVSYRQGVREGRFAEYYNNGTWVIKPMPADPVTGAPADVERVLQGQTLKREGVYKDDRLEGEVKEYDERGRLVSVTNYVAGKAVDKR